MEEISQLDYFYFASDKNVQYGFDAIWSKLAWMWVNLNVWEIILVIDFR